MAGEFTAQADPQQLRRVTQELAALPGGLETVLSRAINKTGVFARARVIDMIVGELNLRKSDVRKRNVTLRKATRRQLFVRISIEGARIPLIHFRSRQQLRGVKAKITKGGTAKLYAGAFQESPGPRRGKGGRSKLVTTMPSGHKGVFRRTGPVRISRVLATRTSKTAGAGAGAGVGRKKGMAFMTRERLPITELRGPSVPHVLGKLRAFVREVFEAVMSQRLAMEIDRQVKVLLERRAAQMGVA